MSRELAEEIRRRGWRQGSIAEDGLRQFLVSNGNLPSSTSSDLLILITHDCSIVSRDFEEEPSVEFLLARAIPPNERNRNYFAGKNPRRLQFERSDGSFEIRVREKTSVAREVLAEYSPDQERRLSDGIIQLLSHWMAKRYRRAALPDVFNFRTEKAREKIHRKLKTDGHLVSAIYVTLDRTDELQDDQSYLLGVYVVAPTADVDAEHERLERLTTLIEKTLSSCNGITVAECQLRAERDFTLEDLNQTIEWDVWDDLSFRETS